MPHPKQLHLAIPAGTKVLTRADGRVGVVAHAPTVIHIEECDFPLRIIEDLLRRSAVRISEFRKDPDRGLLALRFASPDSR